MIHHRVLYKMSLPPRPPHASLNIFTPSSIRFPVIHFLTFFVFDYLFPSLPRFSSVSVVFTFSISLIDFAPSTLIQLSVICSYSSLSLFSLVFSYSLSRFSDVNDVFTFSASLIASAPSSPIKFAVRYYLISIYHSCLYLFLTPQPQ